MHNFELSYIVPLYFNQKNTASFDNMVDFYSKMSTEILNKIQFIFVDDCSPIPISIPADCKLNYQHYRVKTDIKWNQSGARNLGVTKARTAKIVLIDADHLIPEQLFSKLIRAKTPTRLYKFKREKKDHTKLPSPANILFTSKSVFFVAQAYDEEFCGHYGYEDVFFRNILEQKIGKIRYIARTPKVILDDCQLDESYHSLVRDTARNLALYNKKIALLRNKNREEAYHSGTILNFEWELVKEQIL